MPGFHGAMIATQPKGTGGNLDDPDLDPFWELASARGATIFVHPHYICGDERLAGYDLVNAVGRLADTTIAVARLLFSGHLTRFPGMTLVLSHAGGALPYALGRLKRNRAIHPEYADPAEGFAGSISTRCCSSRWRCAFCATWPAPTRSCSAPTSRSASAIPTRAGWSTRPR